MTAKKILIIGNKPYSNFKLGKLVDNFDIIYRFNLAWLEDNNGVKFGKLAMCGHVYNNFVRKPVSKERAIEIYGEEMDVTYLSDWYDFFKVNKESFDEIYYQSERNWSKWNRMLEEYGCPHKFSKIATTGYSTIFRNLADDNNKIYVSGFTLCDDEIRKTVGEEDEFTLAKNQRNIYHSFSDEMTILAWLHNNKKIDASLCMLNDTEEVSINTNDGRVEPSKFILDLLKEIKK